MIYGKIAIIGAIIPGNHSKVAFSRKSCLD